MSQLTKNYGTLPKKIATNSEIWVGDPGSDIRDPEKNFPGSWVKKEPDTVRNTVSIQCGNEGYFANQFPIPVRYRTTVNLGKKKKINLLIEIKIQILKDMNKKPFFYKLIPYWIRDCRTGKSLGSLPTVPYGIRILCTDFSLFMRIRILLLIDMMRICDHWSTASGLHLEL